MLETRPPYKCGLNIKDVFVFLQRKTAIEGERRSFICWFTLQMVVMGQTAGRSLEVYVNLSSGYRVPKYQTICHCFPKLCYRNVGPRWSRWELTRSPFWQSGVAEHVPQCQDCAPSSTDSYNEVFTEEILKNLFLWSCNEESLKKCTQETTHLVIHFSKI